MKDFSNFKANPERMDEIVSLYAQGASAAQIAFKASVQYVLDELEAHREGDKPAPRGCLAAIKKEFEIRGLSERGTLSKSYMSPTFGLASTLHSGKASPMVQHLWDNFLDDGDDFEESVVKGPLYTPGRLNACWGKLNASQDTPFSATLDGIVADDGDKGERPWQSLTIPELKALNAGKQTSPKVAASLMRVLGDPSKLDKRPGELAKVAAKLRTENEEMKSDIIADLCSTIEGFVDDQRNDLSVTLADAEVEAAQKRKLAAEKRRLERAEKKADAPINDAEVIGGEVVTRDEEVVES
jgi:hypothetical protein